MPKKRHHPDGFHLSTSSPKRLLSVSEADSSIESSNESTIRPECTLDSAHGSMWNSASAAITSDCSTSTCVGRSAMSMDVMSSKPPSFGFIHLQAPHRSAASKCEGTASASECSEVTYSRTSVSLREPDGVSFSGKVTHIVSRREKSSLNPKWGMDEAWVKDAFGSETILPEKRLESNSSLHSTSQRSGFTFSSMACESSSCATGESFMEEIRPEQGLTHIDRSVYKESFVEFPNVHTRAEGLVGPGAQERSGGLEYFNTQQQFSNEVDFRSSSLHEGKTEALSPSYVLSSGRLSLEEEARLGRRAPTIDHDFEEYFSSLMLE